MVTTVNQLMRAQSVKALINLACGQSWDRLEWLGFTELELVQLALERRWK